MNIIIGYMAMVNTVLIPCGIAVLKIRDVLDADIQIIGCRAKHNLI